jgi:hypothetical protein
MGILDFLPDAIIESHRGTRIRAFIEIGTPALYPCPGGTPS